VEISNEQLEILKKFIIRYDEIDVEEYLTQDWYYEDYEKRDMTKLYKDNPKLMYMISPYLMFRLQKFFNSEELCAGWCGYTSLSNLYDCVKTYIEADDNYKDLREKL
jgi:hypothetical protein